MLGLVVVSTEACRTASRRAPEPVAQSAGTDSGATPDSSLGPGASTATTVQTSIDRALAQAIGGPLSGRTVLMKDWPERPGFSVALVHAEPDAVTSGQNLDAHVVLLRHVGTGVELVATTTFVPEVKTDPAWRVTRPELDLDFARYELRGLDVAFGLRLGLTVEFPAGENDSRTLYLFRQHGTELVEVLHTRVQETDEQRGPNELRESSSIIAVAPETTGGFHDLVIYHQWSSRLLVTDDPHPKARTGHSSQRWRWDGARYGSPSPEPPRPTRLGHTCTTDDDCAPDCICGYPGAPHCAVRGTCFPNPGAFCMAAAPGCACDGTQVNLVCTGLPPTAGSGLGRRERYEEAWIRPRDSPTSRADAGRDHADASTSAGDAGARCVKARVDPRDSHASARHGPMKTSDARTHRSDASASSLHGGTSHVD
jgi:hypothetical protein